MIEFFLIRGLAGTTVLLLGWLGRRLKWIAALLLIFLLAAVTAMAGDDMAYGFSVGLLASVVLAFCVGLVAAFPTDSKTSRN